MFPFRRPFSQMRAQSMSLSIFRSFPPCGCPKWSLRHNAPSVGLHSNARSFGGDPGPASSFRTLSRRPYGQRAADHGSWSAQFGLPTDVLKSGLLMSGSYDLDPVMLSVRSSYVKISKEEQWRSVLFSMSRQSDRPLRLSMEAGKRRSFSGRPFTSSMSSRMPPRRLN